MRKGFFPVLFLLLSVFACSNDLPLGGDDLPFNSVIKTDSLALNPISTIPFNDFTGNMGLMSSGKVDDPAMGVISIHGSFLPDLKSFATADTITSNMPMSIMFIRANVFGDTTKDMQYELYEINELWRSTELKREDSLSIQSTPISTFTFQAEQDTVTVLLDTLVTDFPKRYADYYNSNTSGTTDSLRMRLENYRMNLFGFQLRAVNDGLISVFSPSTILLKINDVQRDTVYSITSNKYANTYRVSNKVQYDTLNYLTLNSYNESLLNFKLSIENSDSLSVNDKKLPTKSLAKAHIVFYEDTVLLNSLRVPTFKNIGDNTILLFNASNDDDLSDELIKNVPRFTASKINGKYSINITTYINQLITSTESSQELNLYATLRGNDGYYANTVLFGSANSIYYPKIVLIYSETEVK